MLEFLFYHTHNFALECFSEAESAPIRSGAKFCSTYMSRFFSQKYFEIGKLLGRAGLAMRSGPLGHRKAPKPFESMYFGHSGVKIDRDED